MNSLKTNQGNEIKPSASLASLLSTTDALSQADSTLATSFDSSVLEETADGQLSPREDEESQSLTQNEDGINRAKNGWAFLDKMAWLRYHTVRFTKLNF